MADYFDRLTPPILIREQRELSESEPTGSSSESEYDLDNFNSDSQSSMNNLSGSDEITRKISINAVENRDYQSDSTGSADFSDDDSTGSSEHDEEPSFGYYFPRWPLNFDKENVSQDQLELIKYRYTCGVCNDIAHNNVVVFDCKHIFCNCCFQSTTDSCLECGSKITGAFHDAEAESDIKKFFNNMRKGNRLMDEDDFFPHNSFKIDQTSGRISGWSAVNITDNNSSSDSSEDSDEISVDSSDLNISTDSLPTVRSQMDDDFTMNRHYIVNDYFYEGLDFQINDNESDYSEDRLPMDTESEDEHDVNPEFDSSDYDAFRELVRNDFYSRTFRDELEEVDYLLNNFSNLPSPLYSDDEDINMPQEDEQIDLPEDISWNNYNVELEEGEVSDETDEDNVGI